MRKVINKTLSALHLKKLHNRAKVLIRRYKAPRPASHPVQVALKEVMKSDDFTVVQIGAYIGNTDSDPLFEIFSKQTKRVGGSLILVEPVKEYFDQLVKNYRDVPGVYFENVAISDRTGLAKFYRLAVDPVKYGYPAWLAQLSSLKQARMEQMWDGYEKNPELKEFYLKHRVEDTVHCITFAELLQRHGLVKVDLLQMDVEGYEFEILKTIGFKQFPVRFINYERVLLQDSQKKTEKLMIEHGYQLVNYGQDTFCYKKADKHLEMQWGKRP